MQQVSVFAENQRGMMERITGVLRSEDINILGSVTNDCAEYGIVGMVVSVSSRRCSDKSRSSVPSYGSSRRGTDG